MTEQYIEVDALSTEIAPRTLTEERRELVSQTRKGLMKPMEFEEAIAYAIRRKKHYDSPTRRMGTNVGKVMRQLGEFWEGRGGMGDGSIYKAIAELALEIKASERQTRTALEVAMEEGMLTRRPIIRPSDRRQVYAYLCDPVRTLRVACHGRLEHLGARHAREGRPAKATKLERDMGALEATLIDLDDWFGPEEAWGPEQGGWVEGEPVPDPLDEAAPEPEDEEAREWLPYAALEGQAQPSTTLDPADALTAAVDTSPTTTNSLLTLQKSTPEEDAVEPPLQGGADGSPSRDAPFEVEDDLSALASPDNAPRRTTKLRAASSPPELSWQEKNNAWAEIGGLRGDGEVRSLCDYYLNGEPVTVEQIARKVREKIGGEGTVESHAVWVRHCLEGEAQGVNAR